MLYSSLGFLGSAGMIHAELTLQVQCLNTARSKLSVPGTDWELVNLGSGGCSQLVPGESVPQIRDGGGCKTIHGLGGGPIAQACPAACQPRG